MKSEKVILIRCDDIGMCHAVNMAAQKLIDKGIPFSASVMVCCPWFYEAVEILNNAPDVSVGVHLTLNSEWKNYRWGPVLGKEAVPSLVNETGYFFPSRAAFFDNDPKTEEVERELEAQVERAINSGLKVDYIDYHMGTAINKLEYVEIVEKLAEKYQLGISVWFGESRMDGVYGVDITKKTDSLVYQLDDIGEEKVNLLVCHIGDTTPEMNALEDLNVQWGLKNMSAHRKAEAEALLSLKFEQKINENNIKLITYRDLIKEYDLKKMKRPENLEY